LDIAEYTTTIPEGEYIFKQGDPGDFLYIIQEGMVKIIRHISGYEKDLEVLKKGDFFGELAIVMDKPRAASAKVIKEATLLKITRENLDMIFQKRPDIALSLFKGLSERLLKTNRQIDLLLTRDPHKRVIGGLLIMSNMLSPLRSNSHIIIHSSADNLAYELNMDLEVVMGILKELETDSVIELGEEEINILNVKKLKHFFEYFKKST